MKYLLPRAYAVFCGSFNITENWDYLYAQNKVNSPVFVYNDFHLSLKLESMLDKSRVTK